MTNLSISRIKESTFVTVSMIALAVAAVISWVFLMAGTAAVEAQDDELGNIAIDVGFSWWLMILTAILYVGAMLAWIGSMAKGVGLFVALSKPLALLFAVAFAWTGVEMRVARIATGDSSEEDAWFTGLFFTSLTLGLYMLFFATWTDIVGMKGGAKVRGSAAHKPAAEAVAPGHATAGPSPIPAPPGAAAIIADAHGAPAAHHTGPPPVYYTPPPPQR